MARQGSPANAPARRSFSDVFYDRFLIAVSRVGLALASPKRHDRSVAWYNLAFDYQREAAFAEGIDDNKARDYTAKASFAMQRAADELAFHARAAENNVRLSEAVRWYDLAATLALDAGNHNWAYLLFHTAVDVMLKELHDRKRANLICHRAAEAFSKKAVSAQGGDFLRRAQRIVYGTE